MIRGQVKHFLEGDLLERGAEFKATKACFLACDGDRELNLTLSELAKRVAATVQWHDRARSVVAADRKRDNSLTTFDLSSAPCLPEQQSCVFSVSAVSDSERNGDGGYEHWRLRRRAARKKGRQALERMCVRLSAGVRELADNRAEKVGLTRFFRNPRVKADEILRTAAARTGAAAVGRHVLLIEDTSEINYEAKAGCGPK